MLLNIRQLMDDVQVMASQLREGVMAKKAGEVECVEVYIVAGHKGRPDVVAKLGRLGRRRQLKGAPGVSRWPVKSRLSWA